MMDKGGCVRILFSGNRESLPKGVQRLLANDRFCADVSLLERLCAIVDTPFYQIQSKVRTALRTYALCPDNAVKMAVLYNRINLSIPSILLDIDRRYVSI